MTRAVRTVEFTVTAGSRAHCAFCRWGWSALDSGRRPW